MNKFCTLFVACVLMCGMSVSCNRHGRDTIEHDHHSHEHQHEGHSHDTKHIHSHDEIAETHSHEEDGDHDGLIVIEPDDAEMMGIRSKETVLMPMGNVINVSGMFESVPSDVYTAVSRSAGIVTLSRNLIAGASVTPGTTLATISASKVAGGDSNASAYEAVVSAKRELERLKPLHEDGIVSTRDYNEAEAAYRQAQAAYSGSNSGSVVSCAASGIITEVYVKDGEYVDAGVPIATILCGNRLNLRADLPARYAARIPYIKGGNIRMAGYDELISLSDLNFKVSSTRTGSMSGSFVPVYLVVDNPGNFVPGMSCELYLTESDENQVIAVPVSAVSEQQGVKFVYVQLDEDCYRKQPVVTGRTDGERVEIKQGLNVGDKVVSEGMIFVKLAESNGAVPEGHTHNH